MSFSEQYFGSLKHYEDQRLRHSIISLQSNSQAQHCMMLKAFDSHISNAVTKYKSYMGEQTATITKSQAESTRIVSNELRQLSGDIQTNLIRIEEGIADQTDEICDSIQKSAEYLGSIMLDVSFQLSQLTSSAQKILNVLLDSLSNDARQYFEQGKHWFEQREFQMAKERLYLSIECDSKNHLAYTYLGFIAVEFDEEVEAKRNFSLAYKSAEKDPNRASALFYEARAFAASGDLKKAAELTLMSLKHEPHNSNTLYSYAKYMALQNESNAAIKGLKETFEHDWKYFAIAAIDSDFDLIRPELNIFLEETQKETKLQSEIHLSTMNDLINAAADFIKFGCNLDSFANVVNTAKKVMLECQAKEENVLSYTSTIETLCYYNQELHDCIVNNSEWQIREKNVEVMNNANRLTVDMKLAERNADDLVSKHKRKAVDEIKEMEIAFSNDDFPLHTFIFRALVFVIWLFGTLLLGGFGGVIPAVWHFTRYGILYPAVSLVVILPLSFVVVVFGYNGVIYGLIIKQTVVRLRKNNRENVINDNLEVAVKNVRLKCTRNCEEMQNMHNEVRKNLSNEKERMEERFEIYSTDRK
jgi:tetratricopeptide (TPR) repeat protein